MVALISFILAFIKKKVFLLCRCSSEQPMNKCIQEQNIYIVM